MPNYDRRDRVGEEIKKLLTEIINNERGLEKPTVFSLLRCEPTRDFRQCAVYVSVLGEKEELNTFVSSLNAAKKSLRYALGGRMTIHHTPELTFVADDGIARSVAMGELLSSLNIPPAPLEEQEDEAAPHDDI
ncbi:MAG: 30S ribosome-binding factor RbfA [Clostridia bacterium]|nr:30S ribosome-binding factor RbfA [Clostridia bacterium]